jgi:HD-like signal output (HDOD) protein
VQAVAELISHDVAMTAELLKLTNSAYFSSIGRVNTPLQAVRILGFETVQSLVLRIGIFRQFTAKGAVMDLMRSLDVYSVQMGVLTKLIAKAEGADDTTCGVAYCVGLLSSIGVLVLLDSYPDRMQAVFKRVAAENVPLNVAEKEEFGASHGVVGAFLLGLWGFDDTIVEAVAYASAPSISPVCDNLYLTALHAGTILGPSYPPTLHEIIPFEWDMDYVKSAGKEERVEQWQKVADKMKAELGNGR